LDRAGRYDVGVCISRTLGATYRVFIAYSRASPVTQAIRPAVGAKVVSIQQLVSPGLGSPWDADWLRQGPQPVQTCGTAGEESRVRAHIEHHLVRAACRILHLLSVQKSGLIIPVDANARLKPNSRVGHRELS